MPRQANIYGGGANTNANGLTFEQTTSLNEFLIQNGSTINEDYSVSINGITVGVSINKAKLSTVFLRNHGINYLDINSKRWEPDEAFVNYTNNTVYIIEKKFQNGGGSVDEKLATFPFKKLEYEKLFHPLGFQVEYMYLLSREWFSRPQYNDYYAYMDANNCSHYFGDEFTLSAIGLI